MTRSERPAPLARLDDVTLALENLRLGIDEEEPLDAVLRRLAETAVNAIADADAVSVTLLDDAGPRTAATTDNDLTGIDQAQYAAGDGPCLLAVRTREPVRAVSKPDDETWPEFTAAAQDRGVLAFLAVPLLLGAGTHDGDELVGSLNLYSRVDGAFDPFDQKLMRLFTGAASAAISNARRWYHARQQIRHLESALTSRAEIDQAKGVLMAVHGISAAEAFDRLVDQSQRQNIKLRQVAIDLLESVRAR
ncbi:ANTAR domain-containing response regulator [Amycolatopsis methanolica]|uniref:Response regulator receiver and antar domain protein n=1 Tax=Amycolatopsis methanolica 239 TaxID=1068978 RepID=A0A076N3E5_AMYME|nr:GAF and ANTAR domain-containing protein [Amycolatopsis methanolica]AIJ25706.1 response regulator receiver and antar domain protein [Amycolatopsis methanolica 239]